MASVLGAAAEILSAPRRLSRDLWILFLSFFLWCFGLGLFTQIWPLFMQDLGAGPVEIGVLYGVGYVVVTVTYVIGGVLADRFERRGLLIVTWAVSVPAMLFFAWARRWTDLFPGIVLFNSFLCMPAFNAYVAARTRPEERAAAFTVVYASGPLGNLAAPALGGWLAARLGMRAVFLIAFAVCVVSTLVLLILSPQRPDQPSPAGAAAGADAAESSRGSRAARDGGAGRRLPRLVPYFGLVALMYFVLIGPLPYVPTFLRDGRGLTVVHIGALGSVLACSELLISLALGGLGDRWGKPRTLALCLGLFGLSMACLLMPGGMGVVALAFVLRGFSRVVHSLATALVSDLSPQRSLGKGFGAFGAVTGLASAAAPYAAGWVYKATPPGLFVAAAAASVLLAVAVAAVGRAAAAGDGKARPRGGAVAA
ncbi:MAG: MFS transporter [Acetobacteraceae bacterium]|nr:MFS transporter [Acetobacteraceae bacterium]